MQDNLPAQREGNVFKRTTRSSLVISSLAAVTALAVSWGKSTLILGVALSSPLLALTVFVIAYLVWNLIVVARDAATDRRQRRDLESEIGRDPEIREMNKVQNLIQPQPAPS